MVNHIRTLLLNEPAAKTTGGVYTPADFMPVPVPAEFEGVREVLFSRNASLALREATTDGLVRLCHAGELEPYALTFDTRITYGAATDATLLDICKAERAETAVVTAVLERMNRTPLLSAIYGRLFAWPKHGAALSDLRAIMTSPVEGALKIGAVALAFAFQLERVRSGDL